MLLCFLLNRGQPLEEAMLLDLSGLVSHGKVPRIELGTGSFGTVYSCTLFGGPGRLPQIVALKTFAKATPPQVGATCPKVGAIPPKVGAIPPKVGAASSPADMTEMLGQTGDTCTLLGLLLAGPRAVAAVITAAAAVAGGYAWCQRSRKNAGACGNVRLMIGYWQVKTAEAMFDHWLASAAAAAAV